MFWRKTTITRPDRDRLIAITSARANALRWSMFLDGLRREIDRARVVEPTRVPRDVVTMGSTVRLSDLAREREEIYTLAYPDEADLRDGRLSVLSPLGTALLGARAGDVIRVESAAGPRAVKIEEILFQPEAAERHRSRSDATAEGVRS